MKLKLHKPTALLAAAALLLTGCAGNAGASGEEESVIKWGVTALNGNWDPIVTGATGATITMTPIYESLITRGEDGKLTPALAESWTYNKAGDAVTFTLREGATFQDGSPVDAEAVKFFIERAKTQENSALKGSYNNIDTVEAVDATTFVVHLKEKDYQLPYLLSNRAGLVTSKVAAEADPEKLNTSLPVGAGPFKVVELIPEDKIVLEKFDGYWDAENIHIDRIEISGGNDASTLVPALQSGVFNFASIGAGQEQQAEDAGLDVINDLNTNWVVTFLSLNLNKEPFNDPAVVDAVRYAIDREELLQKGALGIGEVANQPFPSGHITYNEELESDFTYDPDKARALLEEAGYKAGDLKLKLYPFSSAQQAYAEIIQQQLGAVGIEVEIVVDPNWSAGYFGKEQAFSLYGYVGRDSHVQALTEHYDEGGVLNLSSPFTSDEFQKALTTIRETPTDSEDYAENLQAASAAGYRNGSTIALVATPNLWAKDPSVSDSTEKIEGRLGWKGVTITK